MLRPLDFRAESLLGLSFEATECRGELGKLEVGMLSECSKLPSPTLARARGGACSCGEGHKKHLLQVASSKYFLVNKWILLNADMHLHCRKIGGPRPIFFRTTVRVASIRKPVKREICYYGQVQTPFNFLIFPEDFL